MICPNCKRIVAGDMLLGEYDRARDVVVAWTCGHCGHTWDRK